MSDLGADTPWLKRPAFKPYEDLIEDAKRRNLDSVGEPELEPTRSPIDVVVNRALRPSWETVTRVVDGLIKLPKGDQGQIRDMAVLLESTEKDNIDTASRIRP